MDDDEAGLLDATDFSSFGVCHWRLARYGVPSYVRTICYEHGRDLICLQQRGLPANLMSASENSTCKKYADAAIADMLAHVEPGDVVFLASLRLPYLVSLVDMSVGEDAAFEKMQSADAKTERANAELNVIPTLIKLQERGARIVFEGPTPMLRTIPYRCSDWFNRMNPACAHGMFEPRSTLERLRNPVLESYEHISEKVSNVAVWDPFPVLCPGELCSGTMNGHPLFFDSDHLSGYSNKILLPSFTNFIVRASSG